MPEVYRCSECGGPTDFLSGSVAPSWVICVSCAKRLNLSGDELTERYSNTNAVHRSRGDTIIVGDSDDD